MTANSIDYTVYINRVILKNNLYTGNYGSGSSGGVISIKGA